MHKAPSEELEITPSSLAYFFFLVLFASSLPPCGDGEEGGDRGGLGATKVVRLCRPKLPEYWVDPLGPFSATFPRASMWTAWVLVTADWFVASLLSVFLKLLLPLSQGSPVLVWVGYHS